MLVIAGHADMHVTLSPTSHDKFTISCTPHCWCDNSAEIRVKIKCKYEQKVKMEDRSPTQKVKVEVRSPRQKVKVEVRSPMIRPQGKLTS